MLCSGSLSVWYAGVLRGAGCSLEEGWHAGSARARRVLAAVMRQLALALALFTLLHIPSPWFFPDFNYLVEHLTKVPASILNSAVLQPGIDKAALLQLAS